ncbi:MAG TPA: Ig-like domain-containing protein, partial [Myxococcus sp.]|nr:Ig-like domain-containing protein [Myxococcus sp.]
MTTPRVEMRMVETEDGPKPVVVPLWEVTYVPPKTAAGTSAVIRAAAVDSSGADVTVEALPVRIAADSAPLITLRQPVGPRADATVGVPLGVSGSLGDDALTFGVDVKLLVDGAAVASTRLSKGGLAGTPAGSQDFSFAWTPPASSLGKEVRIEVQGIDVGGNERRVSFLAVVRADQPPQVTILSPTHQSSLIAGSRLVLTAATQDDSGRPVQVTWFINGAPVGLSSVPPYTTEFRVPASAAGETFVVEAVARDSSGQEKKASATVFATPDVTPPSLAIISPQENSNVVRTQDLLVSAAGLDDVSVKRVEILLDGEVVFTDPAPPINAGVPGSFVTHYVVPSALLQGTEDHRVRARAWDASDNVGLSPEVLIHAVADQPPEVAFTRPLAGAEATVGAGLEVLVDAKDDVAIRSVALFLDETAVGTRTLPPYRFEVPISGAPRGAELRAVATDSGGRTTEVRQPLQISGDQKAPLVGFRAPADGTRVFAGRTVLVEVVASDDVEVAWAELYLGTTRLERLTGGTQEGLYRVFRFPLAVPASAEGTRLQLRAVAADRSGLTGERSQELLAVRDLPPTVTLLSPPPGSPYKEGEDVRLSVSLGDDEGVIGWVGLSGGIASGGLPATGTAQDVSSPRVVTVRAPIVSRGQPDTVGITARDTSGQDTTRTLSLRVKHDTQPPTAQLVSPVAPREGLLEIPEGGSLGVRVEVRDDVRVARVAVLVDGVARTAQDGREPLGPVDERFEEIRTPDPLGPDTILVSREYVGTFAGTARMDGVPPGEHTLVARAYDPAGNLTDTQSVRFRVKEQVDSDPPRLTLSLSGTPDEMTAVAGSTVKLVISASDDGVVRSLTASLDGEPLELPELAPGASVSAQVTLPLPQLAEGEESRTLTFTARAVDGTGKASEASLSRALRPDAAPTLSLLKPASAAELTEEKREEVQVEVRDDVSVASTLVALSTRQARLSTGGPDAFEVVAPGAALGGAAPSVTWSFGAEQSFGLSVVEGAVRVLPHAGRQLGNQPGRAVLRVGASPSGLGARARVTWRYRIHPGQEQSAAAQDFLARNPGGRREVVLEAPAYSADLSFPASVLQVDEIDVELVAASGGSEPLAITRTGLVYDSQGVQARAVAAGEWLAVSRFEPQDPGPGRVAQPRTSLRPPMGWSPRAAVLTALTRDGGGRRALASLPVSVRPDLQPPMAAVTSPLNGGAVVEDAPVTVTLSFQDDVEVESADLMVDGVTRETLSRPGTEARRTVVLRRTTNGAPVALTVVARDRAGNASVSLPVFVDVRPDEAPSLKLVSLRSNVETVTGPELLSGFVRLLQGTDAHLGFEVADDVGVASIEATFRGETVFSQTLVPAAASASRQLTFRPPVSRDGEPSVLLITITDTTGKQGQARLVVEGRRPHAPELAISVPTAANATVAEGSIQLFFQAIAGDDTGVARMELFINGQPALTIAGQDGKDIPVMPDQLGENDLPLALDPAVRFAALELKDPFKDVTRLKTYGGLIRLPPGFVALDPNRTQTTLSLRAVATDKEGHQSSYERTVVVVQDTTAPVAEVLRPTLSQNVVERTPVLVEAVAHDNVFVDRVEILAGPGLDSLQVVHVAGGFPAQNAVPNSPFDIYAPPVRYEVGMPSLAQLGGSDSAPYFVAARARDAAGRWSTLFLQPIDVVRDREPAVAIIAPPNGGSVVESSTVTVTVAAEDDVGIQAVELSVNNEAQPLVLRTPPFAFQVPVPRGAPQLRLQASGVDSFGHRVNSQVVILQVVEDQAPTVALAQPRQGDTLTEGRDFGLVVAAQDDVAISWVEVLVEGGVNGTLRYTGTARPFTFRVPLPYGSAGRTLTVRTRARDSLGKEALAPAVTLPVVADTRPPEVAFLSPADNSEIVEGMRLDVEARADDNVGVASMVFRLAGSPEPLATMPVPPFRFSYRVPRGSRGTTLTFVAEATDTSGLKSQRQVSVRSVRDEPPAVSLQAPAQVVAGLKRRFRVAAEDSVGVAQVSLHAGTGETPPELMRRYVLPYDFDFEVPAAWADTTVTFRAKATDLAGQEAWSAPMQVQVVKDQPPAVAIRRPLPGTNVFDGQSVRIQAEATDPDGGIVRVVFLVDGKRVDMALVPAGIPGSPNVYVGNFVAPVGSGNRLFNLTAVAVDTAGQEKTSAPVAVGTVRDTVAPEVELVDPPDRDLVTEGERIELSAAASDNSSVKSTEFWVDGVRLGSTTVTRMGDANRPLYFLPWLVPGGRAGELVTLHAAALDPSDNRAESQQVKVELGLRPSVTLQPFVSGESVKVGPVAARADGRLVLGGTGLPSQYMPSGSALAFAQASQGDNPLLGLGVVPLEAAPQAVAFSGTRAYVTTPYRTKSNGVYVPPLLSVLDVETRVLRGSVDLPGNEVRGVAAKDRVAFVANGSMGVVVVDVGDPAAPQRVLTLPVVGEARDVFIAGDLLLVAAGPAGLRVLDLKHPRLKEKGFVAVPGGANAVSAVGSRAFVACEGAGAQLAVVDLSQPTQPRLLSLLSHTPGRRDLLATGLEAVSASGNLVLGATQLTDQDAEPVKGMMAVSVVRPDGSAKTLVRANLPAASKVAHAAGGAVAVFGDRLAHFQLQRLVVTSVQPADGERQVPVASPELAIQVELSTAPDASSLGSGTVVLRAADPLLGPVMTATVEVVGRMLRVIPSRPLALGTEYFLTVGPELATSTGLTLGETFRTRFTTRAAAATPPAVTEVLPASGPLDGNTAVTVYGAGFRPGAKVYFSGAEATDVVVSGTGNTLTARTPPQLEGAATVTVVNPDGLEGSLFGGFVYLKVLELQFVVPSTGPLVGGNTVELSGGGFQRGATVTVGGHPATEVRVLSPGRLTVRMPAGPFGPADVAVQTPDGRRVVAPGAYLYTDLTVSSVVGRYLREIDGPVRPDHRLPELPPVKVALSGKKAWVLSPAQVSVSAKDPVELLQQSKHGALSLVDVTDPDEAFVMGGVSVPPPYEPAAIAVRGTRAYVAVNGASLPFVDVVGEGGPSLLVINAAVPTAPSLVTAVPGLGTAKGLALAGDLALMAAGEGGVALFSLVEPERPVLLGAVRQFRFNGVQQQPSIVDVQVSGRYAVLLAELGERRLLVVDLSLPGLPVVGELSTNAADVALYARRGLSVAAHALRTLSLVPATRPHEVGPVTSLVGGTRFTGTALGPQVGALAGGARSALVQVMAASDPARPVSVDAVDLYPAASLSDVAVEGDVIAATVKTTVEVPGGQLPPLDALAVVGLPFPVVTGSVPADGAEAVQVGASLQISLSRPVSDINASTVRLMRVDGTVSGTPVEALLEVEGTTVTLTPSQPLAVGTLYQLRVEGLHATVDGAPMPGAYLAEFTTASDATAVPVSLSGITPRQGPSAGHTDVTLTGSGFSAGMEVRFNGALATVRSVASGGMSAVVEAPAGVAGPATITVVGRGGSRLDAIGAYLYVDPLQLSSVTPGRGPTSGGTRVLISGRGFAPEGTVQVRFGNRPALQVRVLGIGLIQAYTPDGLRGPVDLTVTNPDGTSDTLEDAFTFDQPTGSSVALGSALRDVVVVGNLAYVVGDTGLRVVDISGLRRYGPQVGEPIPPDRRGDLWDENNDRVDDRLVGQLTLPGEATSISYPPSGGDLMFVGLITRRGKDGNPAEGAVARVDVDRPDLPKLVSVTQAGAHGVFDVDARGDRLLAAAAASGLRSFDVSVEDFPVHTAAANPGAQAVGAWEGLAALGVGTRGADYRVATGSLQLWSVEGEPGVRATLPDIAVQRVRLRDGLAVVAAGNEGLVLVDVTQVPLRRIASVDVKGFAWDVRLAGDVAYVAAGAAGVAVVDLSDVLEPKLLYHVIGMQGGEARTVALGGGRLLSLRDRGPRGWSLEFGQASELSVTGASVAAGEVVPLHLDSVTLFFSSAFNPATAQAAFSFTADGMPVPGTLEAGGVDDLRSTILLRLTQPLPPNAVLRVSVSQALRTPDGHALITPYSLAFRSAAAAGERPVLSQVVPRVGPRSGRNVVEVLGARFEPDAGVRIGGVTAPVIAASATRLTVRVPAGAVGLADVEVVQPSGLSTRRPGGYLYVAPLVATHASPRFLNPRGGSTVRVTGDGFLPWWADALGSTRVLVRGLPASGVQVKSFNELVAAAPPGSFGAAEVSVVSPDGVFRGTAPSAVGYGLPFSGEERAVSVRPRALVANPEQPLQVFAAAGAGGNGNKFDQTYLGAITGGGTLPESFRVAVYDATLAGRPRTSGAQIVDAPDVLVDRYFAIRMGYLPPETPLPDIEIMPDSLDVAARDGRLYVANGLSGLVVLDATDTLGLPVLGRASLGGGLDGPHATRVLPTPTGAWVLGTVLTMDPNGRCPGTPPAFGTGGGVTLFDTRTANDPVRIGSLEDGEDVFGAALARGRAYVVAGRHEGIFFCPPENYSPTTLPPPPETSLTGGASGEQARATPAQPPTGSLRIYSSARPGASVEGQLHFPYNITDVVVVRDVAILAAAEYGLIFVDVSEPDAPRRLDTASIPFDSALSNKPGNPQRLRLLGDMLFVS